MNDQEWVERRLQLLDPGETLTPNASRAFARFEERSRRFHAVRRNWIWGSAVATVVCLAMVALPSKSICCARPEAPAAVAQTPTPAAVAAAPTPAEKPPVPVIVPPPPPAPTAPLVCEIYSDFECPACAGFFRDTFPQLEEQYVKTGKVTIVYREFPLPYHRFAATAARYAEAAKEQGVYEAVAKRLYETQSEWGASGNIEASLKAAIPAETLDRIRTLAETDSKPDEAIARDRAIGAEDHINQTPTLVIVTPDGRRHKLAGNPPSQRSALTSTNCCKIVNRRARYHIAHQLMTTRCACIALIFPLTILAQGRGGGRAQTAAAPAIAPASGGTVNRDFVRENYTKFEYRIPMRDGVKLFTSVYIPKDVFSDERTYPMMLQRTGYNVAPYGLEQYRASLGPSELFAREKFIFVYQDVRGRFLSEGKYVIIRAHNPRLTNPPNGSTETDEVTDTWDTIDWLVKHVPGNTGKVGMYGISQPGFYATSGMIDAHPALVAVAPQAPVTDYYMGDDVYHNGAFMLAHRFNFYMGFKDREGDPEPPQPTLPFQFGTTDGYDFFLQMGSLANADEKYFKHQQPLWNLNVEHTTYDEVWQSRAVWKYLKNIRPAVMLVGGWYDTEDPQGLLRQHAFMERNGPPPVDMLVIGPWNHGGFARGDGDRLGNVNFGSKTAAYYRERIEFPFFMYHLKGRGDGKFPKAYLFQTGLNQWRRFDTWPPADAKQASVYPDAQGQLSFKQPDQAGFDEYLSDPNKPVPYVNSLGTRILNTYMTEDQRFAATRPDVLVYKSEVLDHDITIFGPINVDLKVSTTGTDSDFDVKVIDVFPNDTPDYNAVAATPAAGPAPATATVSAMGGYQQLIRGEPFRGKFRKSFEKPVPFEPGKPDRITFALPDVAHTFRAGHRMMIQIQSSWFPLTDRNPQKFMEIPKALKTDFVKATERVYFGGPDGSKISFRMVE